MTAVTTDLVHVLLIDDQPSFRSAARIVVTMTDGFRIVGEAATGEDGVALTAALQPDLVLMDFNLPGFDGLEATRQIRTPQPPGRGPLVVLLSAYVCAGLEHRAAEAGAAGFIAKPTFGPETLQAAWRAAAAR